MREKRGNWVWREVELWGCGGVSGFEGLKGFTMLKCGGRNMVYINYNNGTNRQYESKGDNSAYSFL